MTDLWISKVTMASVQRKDEKKQEQKHGVQLEGWCSRQYDGPWPGWWQQGQSREDGLELAGGYEDEVKEKKGFKRL